MPQARPRGHRAPAAAGTGRGPRLPPLTPQPKRLLKVLLVGAGSMGAEHAAALAGLPGVSIAGIVSHRPARARALARRHATAAFGSLREGLRAARPDAVFVLTPTLTHPALVREAASSGIAVFCEKPLARTLRDAEAVLRAVARARVPFMVGHVLRFFPDFVTLRRLATDGSLGRVGVARLSRGAKAPEGSRNWYASLAASGGPLLDLVIHDFDWLRWTFGPVDRVHACAAHLPGGLPHSYCLAVLRHRSGPIARVEGYWGHGLPFRATGEVAGSRAVAHVDSAYPPVFAVHRAVSASAPAVAVPESPLAKSPYRAQDEAFLEAIRAGAAPPVSGEDALAALKISLAALESVRTGRAVRP